MARTITLCLLSDSASVPSLFLQVKVSLDSLGDSLSSLSVIGDCLARVEQLLKELKTLEEKAQVSLTQHYNIYTGPMSNTYYIDRIDTYIEPDII